MLWTSVITSHISLAVVFLLLLNGLLLATRPLATVDPESLPAAHTWVWWAMHEYREQKSPPKIVVLGSSLVMHPVSRLDADVLNKDLDYVHHHRSVYMEQVLSQRLGLGGAPCFNFSLPGAMVSDDYIVARALVSLKRQPQVIILALSLRDFIDNGVRCAGGTPAFRYLKRFTSIDDIVALAMPQIWQRFDYFFGKTVYLWGKKLDIQVVLAQALKERLGPVAQHVCSESLLNTLDLSKNMPSNLRSEVEEGMFIVKTHQPYSYEDNSKEYRKRYRTANEQLFAVQSMFLDKLLLLCKNCGIEVVIVNMPLTAANMTLMPKGSYDKYIAYLEQAAARWQCPLVDLNHGAQFVTEDFYDTSHMNARGGKKFVDALVRKILSVRTLVVTLQRPSSSSRQLARDGQSL
ncbi:MAG: DUF1574 family protein [Candidatus Melainabacteria bacterium]|nr:DUF1574 family protein [Candidatus Melainabacteria bacterium]